MIYIAALLSLFFVVVIILSLSGNLLRAVVAPFKPGRFDAEAAGAPPDYADPDNWAALPEREGLADLTPAGVERRSESAEVDAFFIHPTGYMHGDAWNSAMDPGSNTEQNTHWMMANQASAFNGSCNVHAPRYREATIYTYLSAGDDNRIKALALAYTDVERAFEHFIENRSEGRPFVLASHSQGTHHAMTLLKNRIAGTPLRDRMVAAYLLGGGVTHEFLAELPGIDVCGGPTDLHCVIHWATYRNGAKVHREPWQPGRVVCTNPLTWHDDGGRAEASAHLGAVLPSGRFSIKFAGKDTARDIAFRPLEPPLPQHTWAEARGGFLYVADQWRGPFARRAAGPDGNYHGLDYPLFHMNIRQNVAARIAAYHTWKAGTAD